MKKDIKWLKEQILILKENRITERDNSERHSEHRWFYNGMLSSTGLILDFINKLDEPEVLSEKWIEKHTWNNHYIKKSFVYVKDLQNIIIPKQELPVIPQFVADYLEKAKEEIDLLRVFEIANGLDELDMWRKEYNWIRLYHLDFARAWLDGYEVEKEQKYLVNILDEGTGAYLIYYPKSGNYGVTGILDDSKGITRFTEQEIKDYDSRYWAFRKPVDEVVGK